MDRSQQKQLSRNKIIETAARLFRTQGYRATGIDQVMEESNLTAGAFYAHFKNKEDLLKEVLIFSVHDTREKLVGGIENKPAKERLSMVLSRYCSKVHRDHPEQGCVLPSIAAELHRMQSPIGPIVGEYVEKWIELTIELLSEIHPDHSRDDLRHSAMNLISQSVGAVLISRVLGQSELSDEILKSARTLES